MFAPHQYIFDPLQKLLRFKSVYPAPEQIDFMDRAKNNVMD